MAGLTVGGFVPETRENIVARIEAKLESYNPGFDFSPQSPDGQLIQIMSFELYQNWQQLAQVYNSYNPYVASGAALRNIGLISGLPYGAAQRSTAPIELQGTDGTVVPRNSRVSNAAGDEFYVTFDTTIPSNAQVVSVVAGIVNVDAGTITTIETPIPGWDSITQTAAGSEGALAQTESQYRNVRQRTVMRNYTSVVDIMQGRLLELGLGQAVVLNNTHPIDTLPDGTPPNTIHVTIGEIGSVDPQAIAKIILDTNAIGCPTFGNQSETITDNQGVVHVINFSTASQVSIEINVDVTYLSDLTAGADDNIKAALLDHINALLSGEDVIWSRLFSYVTPYAKAQINNLTVGIKGGSQVMANVVIDADQFANITLADIILTVT